jgi:hypothetical protein
MPKEQRMFVERRQGPDLLVRWVKWTGYCAWILALIIIGITTYAKPQIETFFDRLLEVKLRKTWDMELMQYAFYLMVATFILCSIALVVNFRRKRRKSDRFNKSILFLGIVSLFGAILYRTQA